MKTKNVEKILLDIVMAVLFFVLTFGFGTSAFFHEVVGIGIEVLFVTHIVMNIRLIKGMLRSGAWKSGKLKNKLLLICDTVLAAGVAVILVTWVLISMILFSIGIPIDSILCHKYILSHPIFVWE